MKIHIEGNEPKMTDVIEFEFNSLDELQKIIATLDSSAIMKDEPMYATLVESRARLTRLIGRLNRKNRISKNK